jgi:hypothetical protein
MERRRHAYVSGSEDCRAIQRAGSLTGLFLVSYWLRPRQVR